MTSQSNEPAARTTDHRSTATPPDQMSDVEALMWVLESDPELSSNVANLTLLDREPDRGQLRERLLRATEQVPLLRTRVMEVQRPDPPRWVPDEQFDIDRHLRWVELPAGSSVGELTTLATAIVAQPFDRQHPLWEFTVVTGLVDGRAAMIQKLHHTITDGEGGIRMSLAFVDFVREAADPAPAEPGSPPVDRSHRVGSPAAPPAAPPNMIDTTLGLVSAITRRGVEAAGSLATEIGEAIKDPGHLAVSLAGLPTETAGQARSLIRQLVVLDGFRSPLWTRRSLERELFIFQVPLAPVVAAGHRLGVSVNDIFVSAATGGAGQYHRDRGVGVDELRISMPVSTRKAKSSGGNSFTPTRVLVPLIADPRQRLLQTHERLDTTKREQSLTMAGPLAALASLVPPSLLIRLARQQVATVDFAVSNLRAAPMDLFIAGSLMEGNYPIGPLGATAWNMTTMSYRGQLDIGVHIDTAAVADPEALVSAIRASFDELVALT